ncbi:metallophosphoesterase, partial [Planctomycetota bacterium]
SSMYGVSRFLAVAFSLCALLVLIGGCSGGGSSWAAPAPPGVQTTPNLLANPGAETGDTTGWTVSAGVLESKESGTDYPDPFRGQRFFFCGQTTTTDAYQDVDVRSHATAIDAGTSYAVGEGYMRSWNGNDRPEIVLRYLDGSQKLLSESRTGVLNYPVWAAARAGGLLPIGTRLIRFVLKSERVTGKDNDGYFDALKLSLSDTPPTPAPPNLLLGPYVQNLSTAGVTIMWETDLASPSVLEYGPTPSLGAQVSDLANATTHELGLFGLTPGTTYHYRVTSRDAVSALYSFKTFPATTPAFRFTLWGDSQKDPNVFKRVVAGMVAEDPDLAICLGDTVQQATGANPYRHELLAPLRPLTLNPFFVARGNHDSDEALFKAYLSQPNNELWFAFTYSNVRFVILDTNKPFQNGTAQNSWLQQELASPEFSAASFQLAFFHHPPYLNYWEGDPNNNGDANVRAILLPMLKNAGVDILFCGHCHDYEYGQDGSLHLVISGGGGGTLEQDADVVSSPWANIQFVNHVYHYCKVDVDAGTLKLEAKDLSGNIFHTLSIP